MAVETWLAFTAASAVLLIVPGPTNLLVLSYALGRGWRVALPVSAGVALGDFATMTLSLLGVGALIAASALVFTIVKWVGALYLIWLGVKLWRAGGKESMHVRREGGSELRMFGHAFLVTALNPKSITFFLAFLPQFVDPHAAFAPQVVVLVSTFVLLSFLNAVLCAALAARAGKMIRSPKALRLVNRAGGALLVGSGLAALAARRAA